MEYYDLINARYSVRTYTNDKIDSKKIDKLLNAIRMAPTAANRQPFRLIIANTEGKSVELRKIYDKKWFVQAPLVVCICGVKDEAWVRGDGRSYLDVDVAIAMDHFILAAANEGLGSCWIANFDQKEARNYFKLPDNVEPIILTPLGYPADTLQNKRRKSLDQLVYRDIWQETE